MTEFVDYMGNARFEIYPELLDIIKRDMKYYLFQGINPLRTPKGNEISHASERLVQLILTDLVINPDNSCNSLNAPLLFAFQKDVFETGNDPFMAEWEKLLESDPFVMIKTTGNRKFEPFHPEDKLFSFAFITLSALINSINDLINTALSEVDLQDSESHPFPELLKLRYNLLTNEQKVVIQALNGLHHSWLVLPLMLATGMISPIEYAKGLVAMKMLAEPELASVVMDAVRTRDYLECVQPKSFPGQQVGLQIREGENDSIEFKSTLRWDIRAGKTNQAVERASLKTISAFLNSNGGTLLIGVRDDGSVEGIESDKFVNEDKFLLHLWTLIRTCLGREVSLYIRTHLEKIDEKTVCVVQCHRSSRPVFLRQPGFNEEFYIRVGPSSNAMDISEALKYIADHFPAG